MPTFNLSNYNCKQVVSSLTEVYAVTTLQSVDIEDITICEPCEYGYSWKVPGSEYIQGCISPDDFLTYLKDFYIDDWHFVKSIDFIEFYYNKSDEVEGTIKYTAIDVTEDEIEVAVSQLSRGESGWAVLIFYGDELTLINDKLNMDSACYWLAKLQDQGLDEYPITHLIKDFDFRKFTYER